MRPTSDRLVGVDKTFQMADLFVEANKMVGYGQIPEGAK